METHGYDEHRIHAVGAREYFDPRRDGRLMKESVVLHGTKPPWIAIAQKAHRFVSNRS